MPHPPLPSSATTDALTLLLSRSSGISRHFTSRRSSTAHFKQQSALCTVGAGILGAKGAEGKRSDDSRARVVDALQGGGRGGRCKGGVGLGRLFAHMYPVWLYEESMVTISIEFTVILYES